MVSHEYFSTPGLTSKDSLKYTLMIVMAPPNVAEFKFDDRARRRDRNLSAQAYQILQQARACCGMNGFVKRSVDPAVRGAILFDQPAPTQKSIAIGKRLLEGLLLFRGQSAFSGDPCSKPFENGADFESVDNFRYGKVAHAISLIGGMIQQAFGGEFLKRSANWSAGSAQLLGQP